MSRPEIEFTDYVSFRSVAVGSVNGLTERVISRSAISGDFVRILELAPGTDTSIMGIQSHECWKEAYIIQGSLIDLSLNKEFKKGMVASRPPGMQYGPWKTIDGCVIYEVNYYQTEIKDKSRPKIEFTDYRNFASEQQDGLVKGISQRIISQGSNSKALVRILEQEPGTDTTPMGVQIHDFWEEIYIIEGSQIDLTLNQVFTKGMVASRPPGMPHGPWQYPTGCLAFEVRYYK